MVSAWDVYAEQLFPLGYGHPLWVPEPCLESGPIRIGDVGYLRAGGFRFMFNSMHSEDHYVNLRMGVPPGFATFHPPEQMLVRRPNEIIQTQLHSASLRSSAIGAGIGLAAASSTAGPSANATLRYQCTESSGAILLLRRPGNYEFLDCKLRIKQYMVEHFSRWLNFANDRLGIGLQDKDLLFVSGFIKTSDWAEATFRSRGSSGELSISGVFQPFSGVSGEFSASMSRCDSPALFYRSGPARSEYAQSDDVSPNEPFDQCIFLQYYKIKNRRFWPTIRAAAEPRRSQRHIDRGDDEMCVLDEVSESIFDDIECCVDTEQSFDPVDCLLDYILERSAAQLAIASVLDTKYVFAKPLKSSLDVEDGLRDALRAMSPPVIVDTNGVGMIDWFTFDTPESPITAVPSRHAEKKPHIPLNLDTPASNLPGITASTVRRETVDPVQYPSHRNGRHFTSRRRLETLICHSRGVRMVEDMLLQKAVVTRHDDLLRGPSMPTFWFLTPRNASILFETYFRDINVHSSVLSEDIHTMHSTAQQCPVLFTIVCTIASRREPKGSALYAVILREARRYAQSAPCHHLSMVDQARAYILMALYNDGDGGVSDTQRRCIRAATRILKGLRATDSRKEHECRDTSRLWLWCYILDRSTSIGFGQRPKITEDNIIRSSGEWYKASPSFEIGDIRISAHVQLLRILSQFNAVMDRDPVSHGATEHISVFQVVQDYEVRLAQFRDDWEERFAQDADITDPIVNFNFALILFLLDYTRLLITSTVLLHDSLPPHGHMILVDRCYEYAMSVVRQMVETLAPSGFMRTSPNMFFLYATAAATHLAKSAVAYTSSQQSEIIFLLTRLVRCYTSPQVALDENHAPAVQARLLMDLVEDVRHQRDKTYGRLDPPSSDLETKLQSILVAPSACY